MKVYTFMQDNHLLHYFFCNLVEMSNINQKTIIQNLQYVKFNLC